MSSYASTQVGDYLKSRFGFVFGDDATAQRLEDHIWEAGRRAHQQRIEVARTARSLTEDAGYVLRSMEKVDKAPYEPNQRGDFAAAVRLCVELEREIQDLVGVHQAVLESVRALRNDLPSVLEHTQALGALRTARAHLEQSQHQVTELLAAREEWASDETGLLRRLDETEKEAKGYAFRLKATDQATTLRIADLEKRLEAETVAARTFHDERDAEAEHVQRYRAEVERLEGLQIQDGSRIAELEALLKRISDDEAAKHL